MSFKEINIYPEIKKDIAFVVNRSVTSDSVKNQIKKSGGRLLTNIDLFDVYNGDNVDKDEKSLAYSLTFQDNSKTLTEIEVIETFNKIIEEVENKCNAKLRNK